MEITAGSIIDSALSERSMTISSDEQKRKVYRKLNEALSEFTTRVPYGLSVETIYMTVPADVDSSNVGAACATTTSPFVLEITKDDGSELDDGTDTDPSWVPKIDKTWDGLMWLAVYHPVRETWLLLETRMWTRKYGGILGPYQYYVSLRYPFPGYDELVEPLTQMRFIAHARYIYLPKDVIRFESEPELYRDQTTRVGQVSWQDANKSSLDRFLPNQPKGPISTIWHHERRQPIPGSYYQPRLSDVAQASWTGPVYEGTDKICFTVCSGKLDDRWYNSPNGAIDVPLWESAPSRPSAEYEHISGKKVLIKVVDIEALEGFRPVVSALHDEMSGYWINLWVSEVDRDFTKIGTYDQVPADGVWRLLAQLPFGDTSYTWAGELPHYSYRLRPHSGAYSAYGIYPRPDQEYTLKFRVCKAPVDLDQPQDAVPIEPTYFEAFKQLFLSKLCLIDGFDVEGSAYYAGLFDNTIGSFRAEMNKKAATKQHRIGKAGATERSINRYVGSDGVKIVIG